MALALSEVVNAMQPGFYIGNESAPSMLFNV